MLYRQENKKVKKKGGGLKRFMKRFFSIKAKLIALVLLLILGVIFSIGYFGFTFGKESLEKQFQNNLTLFVKAEGGHLLVFMEAMKARTIDFSSDGFIRDSLEKITRGGEDVNQFTRNLNRHLITNKMSLDKSIIGIVIIDTSGRVVAATDKKEMGYDESDNDYFKEGLKGVYLSDVYFSRHFHKRTAVFAISAPLTSRKSGEVIGVIVNYFNAAVLNKLLLGELHESLGKSVGVLSGEQGINTYLVNKERFIIASFQIKNQELILKQKADILPVQKCAQGEEITEIYKNFKGQSVIGSASCLATNDWTLLTEVNEQKALVPIMKFRNFMIIMGSLFTLLAFLFIILIADSISRPIKKLYKAAKEIFGGNYGYEVKVKSRDETKDLADVFNRMSRGLKEHINLIEQRTKLTASLSGYLDINILLEKVAKTAKELTGAKYAAVGEIKGGKLVSFTPVGIKKEQIKKIKHWPEGKGLLGEIRKLREPFIVNDISKYPKSAGFPKDHPKMKNFLGAPIIYKDAVVGTIYLTEKSGGFNEHDQHVIKDLAEMAATAINNARNYTQIKELEETSRKILDNAPVGIYVINKEGIIDYVNRALVKLAGAKSAEEIIGLNVLKLPTYKKAGLVKYFKEGLKGKSFILKAIPYVSYIGKKATIRDYAGIPLYEKGGVKKLLLFAEDVTAKVKQQEARAELDKTKSKFIEVVSHQLRTPLSAISWHLESLIGGEIGKIKKEQENFLRVAYGANKRIIETIDDLVLILDIEKKTIHLDRQEIDLDDIRHTVIENFQSEFKFKNIKFKCLELKKKIPLIKADPRLLQKALSKVIDNAVKYSKEGGAITCSIQVEEKNIVMSIADKGIGIPTDDQKRIFEKFYRGHNAAQAQPDASGVGLYIAKRIIEAHGGKIWFKSREGKGTTFYISLPVDWNEQGMNSVLPSSDKRERTRGGTRG